MYVRLWTFMKMFYTEKGAVRFMYYANELIEKLNEITELQNSKESKSKKWDKAKKILSFLLDKGADSISSSELSDE